MRLPWHSKKKINILPPLDGYNRWAATYSEESNPIKNLSNVSIEKLLPDLEGKIVLDAGCGTGHFCQLLEKNKASKIVGLDLSPAMIEIAKKASPLIEFRCQDISVIPLEREYFDFILCSLVIGHIADLGPAMDNLLGSLKKGGIILLTDFHPFLTLQHAQRTFKDSNGKTVEIEHHLHLFQDLIQCFHDHQVNLELLEEPCWNNVPVVYIMKARKQP